MLYSGSTTTVLPLGGLKRQQAVHLLAASSGTSAMDITSTATKASLLMVAAVRARHVGLRAAAAEGMALPAGC